jgi:hypothetical protein
MYGVQSVVGQLDVPALTQRPAQQTTR